MNNNQQLNKEKLKAHILESIKNDESIGEIGRRLGHGNLLAFWFDHIRLLLDEDTIFFNEFNQEEMLYWERRNRQKADEENKKIT